MIEHKSVFRICEDAHLQQIPGTPTRADQVAAAFARERRRACAKKSNFPPAAYCRRARSRYNPFHSRRWGASDRVLEDLRMTLAVHHNSEMGKVVLAMVGIIAFIVVALTWVPELMAPQGGPGASDVGQTVRMIR
jgi:hypothetical protein